jgi:hypothetical protein
MTIAIEPWGGIAVSWPRARVALLVDRRDAWFALRGRLMVRAARRLA